MNNDLISREALRDEYFKKCNRECCTCVERDDESGDCGLIRYAPAVDAEPVRHGRWVFSHNSSVDGYKIVKCTSCGHEAYSIAIYVKHGNYCPSCGARMDGGEDDV